VFTEPLADQFMGKVAQDAGLRHPLLSGIASSGCGKTGARLEVHMGTGTRFRRLNEKEARR
jgi:hypothetical protein